MRPWLYSARLAVIAGLGLCVGVLRADDREPVPVPVGAPVIVSDGPVGYSHDSGPGIPVPVSAIKDGTPDCRGVCRCRGEGGPIVTWLTNTLGCWTHHTCYGCGSLKSEWTFVFGSCRAFFVEPCLQGPPPPLVPAGYGQPAAGYPCSSCGAP